MVEIRISNVSSFSPPGCSTFFQGFALVYPFLAAKQIVSTRPGKIESGIGVWQRYTEK
jgi:hypothetical protein